MAKTNVAHIQKGPAKQTRKFRQENEEPAFRLSQNNFLSPSPYSCEVNMNFRWNLKGRENEF